MEDSSDKACVKILKQDAFKIACASHLHLAQTQNMSYVDSNTVSFPQTSGYNCNQQTPDSCWQNSHVPPAESIWKQFKRWKLQNIVPWAYTTNGSHAETLTDGFWTSFPRSLKEIMALCDTASKCIGQRKVATEHMFLSSNLNPKNQPTHRD